MVGIVPPQPKNNPRNSLGYGGFFCLPPACRQGASGSKIRAARYDRRSSVTVAFGLSWRFIVGVMNSGIDARLATRESRAVRIAEFALSFNLSFLDRPLPNQVFPHPNIERLREFRC